MRHNYESQDSSQQSLQINVNQEKNTSNVHIICRINGPNKQQQVKEKLNKRSNSASSNGPQQFWQKQKIEFNPAQAFILKNLMTPITQTRKITKSPNIRSDIRGKKTRSKSRESRPDESSDNNIKEWGLTPDAKYSVFTTKEQSNLVVVSEMPVKGNVIQEQLIDTKDLQHFVSQSPKQEHHRSVYMFDSVRNELQRQDRFYISEIRPTVRQFIEGNNGCVLFFGPSGGGKSFTMQGKAGQTRGVTPRAVEEILTLIGMGDIDFDGGRLRQSDYLETTGKIYLRASVYMVHCENAYDLLQKGQSARKVKIESFVDGGTNEVMTQVVGLTQQVILNLDQFYNMMQEAFKERRVLSSRLSDVDIRKRSHFVVQFTLVRRLKDSFEEMQKLNFIELAGSEQSVSQPETFVKDTTVRQSITKSFNSLSVQILKVSTKKHAGGEEAESALVNCLRVTLQSNSNITIVNCCSPNQSQFSHTLPAIKFCARIRDTIVRRLSRRNCGKRGDKQAPRGLADYINSLQHELQNLDQKLRIGSGSKTEAYQWCTHNLELIDKALYDCRKSGKGDVVSSLEYYKNRITDMRQNTQSPERFFIDDKEKVFNKKVKDSFKITEPPKRDTSLDGVYEDDGPISYRSKKSDQAHQRYKSDQVQLPAHLKSLIEYKSTQKLSEMQDKFLSSQKIKDLIGGVGKPQQQLYESSEQTLQDIQRLILLEDFSGLKRRVMALSKERLSCNDVIISQTIEIEELRMQLDARDDMVREVTQLTQQNLKECSQQIKYWEDNQQMKEEETSKHIKDLEFTLSHTVTQFEEIKKIKEESEMRLLGALRDVDEQKKAKIVAETKLKEVSEQNEKIMLNYEVLKEHELNIIKDCSNKQKESKQLLAAKLSKLEQIITNKDNQTDQLQQQIRDQDDQVRSLKFEVLKRDDREKLQSEHMKILECKVERQQRDSDELQLIISKMKREIQTKDDKVRELVNDNKEAMSEISQLQNMVNSFENQSQALNEDIKQHESKFSTLLGTQKELIDAKTVADECIRLKNKDLEAAQLKLNSAQEELKKVNQNYRELEKANLRIKANEYDKVDVMRRNIELETTIKSLKQELDDVVMERNKSKKMGDARQDQNQTLLEQNKTMAQEIENMKRTHENTLNSFDKKFTEFSNELMLLTNQNTQLKEAEKTFKRRAHVMELENVEWREKCKYLEMRHYDASDRRLPDIRSIQEAPRTPTVTMKEIKQELQQQDNAFGDIKSLINNFKKEREQQKESKSQIFGLNLSRQQVLLKSENSNNY